MNSKLIHVRLKQPREGREDFFYGSLKAIYLDFTREELGIGYDWLGHVIREAGRYENTKVTITKAWIKVMPHELKNIRS